MPCRQPAPARSARRYARGRWQRVVRPDLVTRLVVAGVQTWLGLEGFVFFDELSDLVLSFVMGQRVLRQTELVKGRRPLIGLDQFVHGSNHILAQLVINLIRDDNVERGSHRDIQIELIDGGDVGVFRFVFGREHRQDIDVAGVDLALDARGGADLCVDFAAHDRQDTFPGAVGIWDTAQLPVVLFVELLDSQVGLSTLTGDRDREFFTRVRSRNEIFHRVEYTVSGYHQGK